MPGVSGLECEICGLRLVTFSGWMGVRSWGSVSWLGVGGEVPSWTLTLTTLVVVVL